MIKIQKFVFNSFSENTFLLFDEKSKDCVVIDPGCENIHEEDNLSSFIRNNKLNIKYLINTHCHIDHILGNRFIKEKYKAEFLAPEKDLPLLENLQSQAAMFGMKVSASPHPDKFITEDSKIELANEDIQFLFTPGHTPGEFCIYLKNSKLCITGDVLFRGSIGRTDLWGGNYEQLSDSIKKKLFSLPDDVIVYPGHGELSSIGYEKLNNPFLADS